jgi:hypothetical protein
MIVSAKRDDLRDEFTMANEAFALSPISARAAQPSQEDYDAISEAFMETSRGRWFLGEYAKRNRNADTRMVLDAVARIEETLSAQRQPPPESGLPEALAAIRSAVDQARTAASAALDSLALEENLAPVRKGARVIREISWRLREIGADGRICDLIDSQVSAIQGTCGRISSTESQAALSAAFDLLTERIGEFGESEIASAPDGQQPVAPSLQRAEEAIQSPSLVVAPDEASPAALDQSLQAPSTINETEATVSVPAEEVLESAEATGVATEVAEALAEVVDVAAEVAELPAEAVGVATEVVEVPAGVAEAPAEAAYVAAEALNVTSEAADKSPDAAEAYDDALLDMVALEMAAPDPSETDTYGAGAGEVHVLELASADPVMVAEKPEPTPVQPTAIESAIQPSTQPSSQPSLGSTLIANGIVRRPNAREFDPLAPIRRMSQAERIALFS